MDHPKLEHHWPMLYRFLLFLLHDREDARDVAQETYRIALAKGPDPQKGSDHGAWLRSIARNLARNHIRKRRRQGTLLPPDFLELAEARFLATGAHHDDLWHARQQALGACLEKLPEPDRQLIRRRYELGHKVQRIAQSLRIEPNTLSKRLSRIRTSLRRCIESTLKGESRG